jgi:GNAT superfamily N-acetyltransferase
MTAFGEETITIERIEAGALAGALDGLATVLHDCVEGGASVNFLAGFTLEEARAFWSRQRAALQDGHLRLYAARAGDAIVGTVMLALATQPNQPHRGEILKMMVTRAMRGRGVGAALLAIAEREAKALGRTLLVLDTAEGSAGERLYRRMGWEAFGRCEGYALNTVGEPEAAVWFRRILASDDRS